MCGQASRGGEEGGKVPAAMVTLEAVGSPGRASCALPAALAGVLHGWMWSVHPEQWARPRAV